METLGILLLATLLVGLALWAGLAPTSLMAWIERFWRGGDRVPLVVALRVLFGVYLIAVADATPAPTLTTAIGVVFVAAGAAVALLGRARIDRVLEWWLDRPPAAIRSISLVWLAFVGLLFYLGLASP